MNLQEARKYLDLTVEQVAAVMHMEIDDIGYDCLKKFYKNPGKIYNRTYKTSINSCKTVKRKIYVLLERAKTVRQRLRASLVTTLK